MLRRDEIDFSTIDYRALTPEQWALVKKQVVARAHAERSQALRDSIAALWAIPRQIGGRALAFVAHWRTAARARRTAAADIAKLHRLDDRMLADVGIRRGDVSAVVRGGKRKTPARLMTDRDVRGRIATCELPFSAPGRRDSISPI